ncbi:reticulon-1a isoform X1 [Polypterus senegalus]|uniref:reticulon-1a isoform X1 n=1 Tax=Polypterus senegalus TaxID=55291 RepID=UPI001963C345|nr:reticulon-1a isoform X1 [Polypterus senegalus]
MSTHPNVESGSDSNWFGEDFEQIDRFGNSLTTVEEKAAVAVSADVTQRSWREEQPAEPANSRPPPPVTMETVSTGHAQYSGVGDPLKFEKTAEDNGTFYTSLLSGLNPGIHQDPLSSSGDQNWDVPSDFKNSDMKTSEKSRDRIPSFESQSMFSSDSGIEMTPGESIDSKNILECEKMEGYHYIDISCSRNTGQNDKGVSKGNLEEKINPMNPTPQMLSDLGDYSEKRQAETPETLGAALEKHHCPYVEDLSDEDTSDYQIMGNPNKVSPVKITLTQIDAPLDNRVTVSEKESILSLGLEGVPTVTLSEPEDDSLGSSTPPLTEESESPAEFTFHSGDKKSFSPTKSPDQAFGSRPRSPSPSSERDGIDQVFPRIPSSSLLSAQDPEVSSTESEDSDIKLLPEEPLISEEIGSSGYMTFGQIAGSSPSPVSPLIQYSILREEREAELDSDLIIESCDASSASEESPKREQDSPLKRSQPIGNKVIDLQTKHVVAEVNSGTPNDKQSIEKMKNLTNADDIFSKSKHSAGYATPEVRIEQPSSGDKFTKKATQTKAEIIEIKKELHGQDQGAEKKILCGTFLHLFERQKAIDLLYWRDLKQTGILFGSVLLLLFSLTQFSVVSVIAYLALAALSATISFRIYKSVLQAVQKTDEGHPFKAYLDVEISLSQEQIQKYADNAQLYLNSTMKELRRLFLVQDLVDSLKFAVLMWLLTYVGALFNGLTLLIMAVISMFTMPVVYEKYQVQIDQYLGLVRTHVNSVVAKIQAKIPGAKRKAE